MCLTGNTCVRSVLLAWSSTERVSHRYIQKEEQIHQPVREAAPDGAAVPSAVRDEATEKVGKRRNSWLYETLTVKAQ